MPCRASW